MIDIAIVGIGCRYPGGISNPDEFWSFLINKGDAVTDIPKNRWNIERFYDPDPEMPGKMYTKRGAFLTTPLDEFDPEYFGISHREATIMDPQQRLILEVAQEALDDAGYANKVAGRPVGVYIGGFTNDSMALRHNNISRPFITTHTPTSSSYTMLSNRVSFVFDLRGPSMTIDTACSSSLVALHEAVSALQQEHIEMAMVGGVNVMLRPETFISMCKGHFLAEDGRSKAFDKDADGYGRGEGAGMLLLRPLEKALADGDRVYAVIRATGVNQDGRTSGITVPNPQSQTELIHQVTKKSGLKPADIGFIEAHGTGTGVGDPLEMKAIGNTLGCAEGREKPLYVGSIKSSIGHTEAASGVASVIKTALSLYHRTIVPQAWLNELNPVIPFDTYQLSVPLETQPFPSNDEGISAASINSFGYGGTNAHAILVNPPSIPDTNDIPAKRSEKTRFFPVSGRNDAGARSFAADLAEKIEELTSLEEVDSFSDAIWKKRAHHLCRFSVPYASKDELMEKLTELGSGGGKNSVRILNNSKGIVFVLSGMGPQWWAMGRQLLTTDSIFSRLAQEIDEVFKSLSGWSLVEELLKDEADSKVTSTEIAQTGNFLLQVGLVAELEALGVKPAALVGHSVGEVSAAYLSGTLSLKEAVTVSYHRSRLQALQAGTGGMMAVGLSESDIITRIANLKDVEIAAVNSPSSVTLAGDLDTLKRLAEQLETEGVFNRILHVEVPYHSHFMDPILDELKEMLSVLAPQAPTLPLYSTVTGKPVDSSKDLWDAEYWQKNVRDSVRFADAVENLINDGFRTFLEIGPHPVLSGNIREILLKSGETGATISTLSRNRDDMESLRNTMAELYAIGALDETEPPGGWVGISKQYDLPVHKFQRTKMWFEPEELTLERLGDPSSPILPGLHTLSNLPEWETDINIGSLPWLKDHVVAGSVLLPGAAFIDAALAAAASVTKSETPIIEEIEFISPLVIDDHEVPVLRLSADPDTGRFVIKTKPADSRDWTLRARGRIVYGQARPLKKKELVETIETTDDSHTDNPLDNNPDNNLLIPPSFEISTEQLYEEFTAAGLSYGPYFRRIEKVKVNAEIVSATINGAIENNRHRAHPAIVDCAFQCMAAWGALGNFQASGPVVPAAIHSVRQFAPLTEKVTVNVSRCKPQPGETDLVADIILMNENGESLLEFSRVQFSPIAPRLPVMSELDSLLYESEFIPLNTVEQETLSSDSETESVDTVQTDTSTPNKEKSLHELINDNVLFIVGTGEETQPWVSQLVSLHPENKSLIISGNEPAEIAEEISNSFSELISVTEKQVTVVLCAVGLGESEDLTTTETFNLQDSVRGVSALVGLAIAVQNVFITLEEEQPERQEIRDAVRGLVLTRRATRLTEDELPNLVSSAIVGTRRVLRNEFPALRWNLIDVDGNTQLNEALNFVYSSDYKDWEADEITLRNGIPYVEQLKNTFTSHKSKYEEAYLLTDPEKNFELEIPKTHLFSDLSLRETSRREPGEFEVELRIDALELNYKDALKVLGMLGEKELGGTHFGLEVGMFGVAVVTRIGPDVTECKPGDKVVVGVKGMARRYITTRLDQGLFVATSPNLSTSDYNAMVPMMTAHYSIYYAAHVMPDDVVLVHGGAGGVGMASIQAAKLAGARVIATASTEERREAARQMGADEVLDSRSLNFVEDVLALTDGHGADVIISSAPGEFITANLKVAAEFGRVIEVGKFDIFTKRMISLSPFKKNLSFISIDIDRMVAFKPKLVGQLHAEVMQLLHEGKYKPLPGHLIPLTKAQEAFDMVLRSKHIGRVMLDFTEPNLLIKPSIPETEIDSNAAYLITGGFGAFGLATARWLVARGATTLILVSRNGATTPDQIKAVEDLQHQNVNIISLKADVSDKESVDTLISNVKALEIPLKGIFHTAGIVIDGPFMFLREEAIKNVMLPKALGAFNLHNAIEKADISVDYFVLYSSITAITGTVPQTSYAAANMVLDTLASYRRKQGLAATVINWGPLRGGGMAEASEEVARYLGLIGFKMLDMERSCLYMDKILGMDIAQAMVADVHWGEWGRTHATSASTKRFFDLVQSANAGSEASNEVWESLCKLPPEERQAALLEVLLEHISQVMGIPVNSIDIHTPLPELGLDSLMGVELNLRLTTALGVELSTLEFTRGGGLSALASRLLKNMEDAADKQ